MASAAQTVTTTPTLIIGAGIVGLTLAQFLRQMNVPFVIFERDRVDETRSQGWGLTLHWALDYFLPYLPSDIRDAVFAAQVDQSKWENDNGNFLFIDLATLEPKLKVPSSKRLRVQRDKLRKVLAKGVEENILWGKKLVDICVESDGVTATFEDGTSYQGLVLVGTDGSRSKVRELVSSEPQLYHLRIRMLGVILNMTEQEAEPLQAIDPLLFQGSLPLAGTFLYTSLLDVSTNYPSLDQPQAPKTYTYQFCISHPTSAHGDHLASIPFHEAVRILSQDFHPTLRSIFHSLPSSIPIKPISIADWSVVSWDGRGRTTLAGDAAHAMTMFRGDGANQGIMDVFELSKGLSKLYRESQGKSRIEADDVRGMMREYEGPMMHRARTAVLLSRQACLDAHGCGKLSDESPVVSARVSM